MITLEPSGVEAARGPQLMVNITSTYTSTPAHAGMETGGQTHTTSPRLLYLGFCMR
jgi:hypothetical protein